MKKSFGDSVASLNRDSMSDSSDLPSVDFGAVSANILYRNNRRDRDMPK